MLKRAVALKYRPGDTAPFLLCKERGRLAERIVSIAEAYGVETVQDQELLDSLFVLEEGDFIPEELFETVAALLAFVYRTRSK